MNPNRFVGTWVARIAFVCFALLGAAALGQHALGLWGESRPWMLKLSIGCGLLALVTGVHWSRPVYAGWMRFAKLLNAVTVTLLFAVVYVGIVPIFFLIAWALDPLRLRTRPEAESFWIKKRATQSTAQSLQSMA
jgi:hypothetical protein